MAFTSRLPILRRRPELPVVDGPGIAVKAVKVAAGAAVLADFPDFERRSIDELAKAVSTGSHWNPPGVQSGSIAQMTARRPVSAEVVARQAHQSLAPSSMVTPVDIEMAMRTQGMDWVEPFAPGRPLTPYYGYSRRPRERNYMPGRNVMTETRPGRIPYATIRQLIESYDIAMICIRHAIQDLRSMRIRYEVMDGYGQNAPKEIARAKEFMAFPDGKLSTKNWMAKHAMDVWRFDCGSLYRQRDRAGNLIRLPVPDGTLFAPMLDYFGDNPDGKAPAFMQFIQGIPWDTLNWDELIYSPMWPHTEDPYGVAPIETILVNANTDLRLQTYFLQFFTTGTVPEAFGIAPEDQSDPDSLAEWQETYNDWSYGDQAQRWGLRWLPHGTELEFYKPQQFDPDVAEYVMRRTVGAFMMMPQDLGLTADINRATADTQMDTQFRINSLPNVSYYEDLLDSILQNDLHLPVQMRFDTGREKEDRLVEAQAHQIYVSVGAESPDELREKVLGLPIDPDERVGRLFDSQRLGPIPLSELIATSGDIDPITFAPKPGTVTRREYQPLINQTGVEQQTGDPNAKANPAPQAGGARPKGPVDRTKVYPKPVPRQQPVAPQAASRPGTTPASKPAQSGGAANPRPRQVTASQRGLKEATAGIGISTGIAGAPSAPSEEDEENEDLYRWRRKARKAIAAGKPAPGFADSAITPPVYAAVWASLEKATSREEVDEAFVLKAARGYELSPRSGMVSLDVPDGLLPSVDGGIDDHHITVVYLGKDVDDDLLEHVQQLAASVAGSLDGPLDGSISGQGTFPASNSSDGMVPVYAVPDIPGIENLRAAFEQLNASEFTDYHPHVTLAYIDEGDELPPPLEPTPVTFTHLSVHRGDDVYRYPFGGALKEADEPEVAGIALVAEDTGRVLMVQRGNKHD